MVTDGRARAKESALYSTSREDDPSQSISSNSSSRINSSSSNSSSRINSINSINGSSVGNSSGRQTKCSLYPRDSLCSTQESGEHSTVSRSTSVYSTDSGCGVLQCFTNRLTLIRHSSGEADKCTDHFSYLLANDNEYLNCLHDMLSNYNMMCSVTPPHIRQHLDVFFLHMETLYQFQIALHGLIKATGGNAAELSQVFTNDQFQLYSRCMIMTPNALRDFSRYSAYFEEHFPHLKRNLLKPSMRINFYVMMLDTFKNGASEKEKVDLESARDYLNQLKREANTIMTVATVVNSPLDLRLGGEVLQLGELLCLGGGSLQKKKYNIILFEHLLVITSSKMDYFKYKTHYRAERLEAVESAGDQELVLHAFTEGQHQLVTMRFKAKSTFLRDEWVKGLHKIIPRNDTSSQREGKQSDTFSTQVHSQMFPLYLFSEYPHLSSAMVQQDFVNEIPKLSSVEESCLEMFLEEKAYVRQLSSLLNPEAILPPETLCSLLEKLYQLHSKILLPYLDRSLNIYNIFRLFFENIDSFSIYVDYLVVRSQVISQFNSSETRLYISPVQHLTFYLIWLQQLCRYPDLKESAQKILDHFKTYVKKAQIRLLTDAISNARIDFYRSGNILRHDRMEVKTRKKELRGGLYLALLFENIILLTKPKPPFYEYAWDIWLDQVNLGPPTNSDVVFKLEVRQGGGREPVTCEFRVASPAIKQEWLKCMQQQMLQQAQKIRQRTSADF
nr:uncharacterized protein LOC128704970 [Cherax quadricarinatus]